MPQIKEASVNEFILDTKFQALILTILDKTWLIAILKVCYQCLRLVFETLYE